MFVLNWKLTVLIKSVLTLLKLGHRSLFLLVYLFSCDKQGSLRKVIYAVVNLAIIFKWKTLKADKMLFLVQTNEDWRGTMEQYLGVPH